MATPEEIAEIVGAAEMGPGAKRIESRYPAFNPWADIDPLDQDTDLAPLMRRLRLWAHLSVIKPKLLLVGEAPGYQGCHFSGVPFTNEALICAGTIPRIPAERITTREKPWSEPSATIVWRTLHELGVAEQTIMWNAYPWHPHKPGEPMSNRTPTGAELKDGLHLLSMLIRAFPEARVVAVGRNAEKALSLLGRNMDAAVRHPSMGGANEFRSGMAALMSADRREGVARQLEQKLGLGR
jgi:hypothetical protein